MSRTIEDLKATLSQHAEESPGGIPRTAAVRSRVRRIRRQRSTAGVASVAALVAVALLGVHAARSRSSESAFPTEPLLLAGGRLAATMDIDSNKSTSVSATVVPTSSHLLLVNQDCSPRVDGLGIDYVIDSSAVGDGTCGTTIDVPVPAGRPVTVEFRLTWGDPRNRKPITADELRRVGRIRAWGGVYLPVTGAEPQLESR